MTGIYEVVKKWWNWFRAANLKKKQKNNSRISICLNFCGAIVDHFLQFWLDFTTTTRRENAFVFEMLSCYIVIVLLLLPACLHYRSALQCHIFAGCVIFIVKEHWESILWYVYDYDSQSAHHKVGRFKVFQVCIYFHN